MKVKYRLLFLALLALLLGSCRTNDTPKENDSNSDISSPLYEPEDSRPTIEDASSSTITEEIVISHEHTFNKTYSYDKINHWLDANCGHNEISGLEKHNLEEYEIKGYKCNRCSVCSYNDSGSVIYDLVQTLSKERYTLLYSYSVVNLFGQTVMQETKYNKYDNKLMLVDSRLEEEYGLTGTDTRYYYEEDGNYYELISSVDFKDLSKPLKDDTATSEDLEPFDFRDLLFFKDIEFDETNNQLQAKCNHFETNLEFDFTSCNVAVSFNEDLVSSIVLSFINTLGYGTYTNARYEIDFSCEDFEIPQDTCLFEDIIELSPLLEMDEIDLFNGIKYADEDYNGASFKATLSDLSSNIAYSFEFVDDSIILIENNDRKEFKISYGHLYILENGEYKLVERASDYYKIISAIPTIFSNYKNNCYLDIDKKTLICDELDRSMLSIFIDLKYEILFIDDILNVKAKYTCNNISYEFVINQI